jgi:hypothetical protein
MVNYSNGKIYKIESHSGDKIYIGSTTKQYLSQRMDKHRADYKFWKNGKGGKIRSFELFDEYGIENCSIILLELFPCNTKDELVSRESFYIRTFDCVNKVIPGRSLSEWRDENKGSINKWHKEYYQVNKEKHKELLHKYYIAHKEAIQDKKKQIFHCDCGIKCIASSKSRHLKSAKHTKNLEAKLTN